MQLDMTKGKPLPIILRFTIPLMIGNVFQQLYNMADTIIVGRFVGAGALAAVGSTGTIMFLTTGFAQGITAGFSILTAMKLLSYPLACFADPAAWIAAAVFTGVSYLFVIKKIERSLGEKTA